MEAGSTTEAKTEAARLRQQIKLGNQLDHSLATSVIFEYDVDNIAEILSTGLYKMALTADISKEVGDFNKERGYMALTDCSSESEEHKSTSTNVKLLGFMQHFCAGDWLLLQLIGSGADGDVWKAVQKGDLDLCDTNGAKLKDGKDCRVLKLFDKSEPQHKAAAKAECDVWLAIDAVREEKVTPTPERPSRPSRQRA